MIRKVRILTIADFDHFALKILVKFGHGFMFYGQNLNQGLKLTYWTSDLPDGLYSHCVKFSGSPTVNSYTE